MMPQVSEAVAGLGQSADALEGAMRAAVQAEITETVKRWKTQGSLPTKVARQIDGDPESEALLSGWTRLWVLTAPEAGLRCHATGMLGPEAWTPRNGSDRGFTMPP